MKRQSWFTLVALLVVASMVLAACQPPATPTNAPIQPTTPPAANFKPLVVSAPDCNYGTADNPAKLKSIEAVDQYTVKFTLCSPDPAFPSKVAFSVFSIVSQTALDAAGGDSVKLSDKPDGTGPYMLKEWVRGDHITYVANPNYWGAPPKAKTLIFRWSAESAQRLLELQSGTVDGIDNPAPEDFDKISANTNLKLYPRPALNIFYIGFQNTMKPFDNEKVRQALAMAIDKKRIVDNFYPKGSLVAEQFEPEVLKPGYTDGLKWYDFDVAKAKQTLSDAGFPNGFETTLSYRNVVRGYLPNPAQVAQEIQAELANINVKVTLKEMESAAFIDATSAGKEPMYLLGWGADYPDSTNFVDYHFANPNNLQFGTPFPDLVAEINAAAKLSDPAQRQQHYDKVNELIKQHVPMVPVAHGGSATVFKADVTGAHASPLTNEVFAVMQPGTREQLVWMQNGEPAALWCSDETDGETLRGCEAMYDSLLAYKIGGTEVEPALAQKYTPNADLTEWTFNLRQDVKFASGKALDANDVVATYASQWDASNPNHKGRTTTFEYFGTFFGPFVNAKK
ncbi:MAG: ABC transporter substrate-binding protein [Anaerolineaceae bacterium]|nr:ABC transporter substrate-binding protein [Anaerolineaceae bacterium]